MQRRRCANCNREIDSQFAHFCRMCWQQLPVVIQNIIRHDDMGIELAVKWFRERDAARSVPKIS